MQSMLSDYAWGLSNTLDAQASLEVVKQAIKTKGKPEIPNSDQGSQFTCLHYVNLLKKEKMKISMDGKGRALDNIYIKFSGEQSSINTGLFK